MTPYLLLYSTQTISLLFHKTTQWLDLLISSLSTISNFFRKYFLMTSPEASARSFATSTNRSRSVALSSEEESLRTSVRFEFEAIAPRETETALGEDDTKDSRPTLLEVERRRERVADRNTGDGGGIRERDLQKKCDWANIGEEWEMTEANDDMELKTERFVWFRFGLVRFDFQPTEPDMYLIFPLLLE